MSDQVAILLIIIYIGLVILSRTMSRSALAELSADETLLLQKKTSDISRYSISGLIIISVLILYFFKNHGVRLVKSIPSFSAVVAIYSVLYFFWMQKTAAQLKDILKRPVLFVASKTLLLVSLGFLFAVLYAYLSSKIDVITYVHR